MNQLINQGLFMGTYDTVAGVETATTIVTTTLVNGLTATKIADKTIWVNGNLTYTININNNSGIPYDLVTFTDVIDPNLATLVEDSVRINDIVTAYNFDAGTGLLSLEIATIADGTSLEITFQVYRV